MESALWVSRRVNEELKTSIERLVTIIMYFCLLYKKTFGIVCAK